MPTKRSPSETRKQSMRGNQNAAGPRKAPRTKKQFSLPDETVSRIEELAQKLQLDQSTVVVLAVTLLTQREWPERFEGGAWDGPPYPHMGG